MLITKETSIVFILLFLSCISQTRSDTSDQKMDTCLNEIKGKDTLKAHNANFHSSIDTNLIDTINYNGNLIIIESITDSLYNELYSDYFNNTRTITNPYNEFRKAPQIETDLISKNSDYVSRHGDTLELRIERGTLELINTYHHEVDATYFYIGFLNLVQSHIVFVSAEGGVILVIPFGTGEKLILGSKIYLNDSFTKVIFNDFSVNELDGGWYNNFNIVESDKNCAFIKIVTIDFPNDYRDNFKTWGISNPFWTTKDNIVFTYNIGEMGKDGFKIKYFFAKMKIIRSSAANTRS